MDYEHTMKTLVRTVVRTFYEPFHVVICDILLENILLSDTEFAARMKMLSREFNKLIVKLKEDRIIKTEIKMETTEENKQFLKTMYFFDFVEVKDIIKYKIFQMTKLLEVKRNTEEEAFYCPSCEKSYSALDAQACIVNYVFKCIFCKNDLVESVKKDDNEKLDLKELLASLKEIIALLKESDKFTIPTMDYFQVLEMKKEKENTNDRKEEKVKDKQDLNTLFEENAVEEDFDVPMHTSVNESKESKNINVTQDLYLTVQGKSKKYSDITDADLEVMTEDEYSKYYDVHMKNE